MGRARGAADPGGLSKIGIKATIDKIPGANGARARWSIRSCRCISKTSAAGSIRPTTTSLGLPEGQSLQLIELRRRRDEGADRRNTAYGDERSDLCAKIKRMIAKAFDDVPRIPLWQPFLDSAMRKDVAVTRRGFIASRTCASWRDKA